MDIVVLREKLHEYINVADEQHLSAIYVLVEGGVPPTGEGIYDEAIMKMLYDRRGNHRKGVSKSYTAEESINIVRQKCCL